MGNVATPVDREYLSIELFGRRSRHRPKIFVEQPEVPKVEYSAAYLPAIDVSILPKVAAIAREESWFFGPPRTRRNNFGMGPFPALQVRTILKDELS